MSAYKGEATIRAPSEYAARSIAAVTLGRAQMMTQKIVSQPWLNPMHVRTERADGTPWAEDGPFMILDPPGYEDDFTNVIFPSST